MNGPQIVREVERRAAEAYRKPEGPDYEAIARAVAEEAGRPYEDVRRILTDAWAVGLLGSG